MKPFYSLTSAASCFSFCLIAEAGIITWDNEAEQANGDPNTSWFADENWDSNLEPESGDDVRILSHGDLANPVKMTTNSATVNSIICRVPFDLGSTLIVNAPSEFENSLIGLAFGTLRANGVIVLKGNNNGQRTAFEGTAGYRNEGSLSLASRSVSAPFVNAPGATVSLNSQIGLSDFSNRGTLQLGTTGEADSASSILNEGLILKNNPDGIAEISGNLVQATGMIEVAAGAELMISGRVQRFQGGSIKVDGTLLLTSSVGGTPERLFEGLTGITGQGTVNQVFEYEVDEDITFNLSVSPGYQLGNLALASGVVVTNAGQMTISSTETITAKNGNPLSVALINQGTIGGAGNPLFEVYVENRSEWNATSMRLGAEFENMGTLRLDGGSARMSSVNGGFLGNTGLLSYDPTVPNGFYTVAAEVRNRPEGKVRAVTGRITLEAPSPAFSGEVEAVNTNALVRLWGSNYLVIAGDLKFSGGGQVDIGTPGAEAAISHDGNDLVNTMGDFRSTTPDDEGLWLRDAELYAPNSGAVHNHGVLHWRDCEVINALQPAASRFNPSGLVNWGLIILETSGSKYLEGTMVQLEKLRQKGALSVNPDSFVLNTGTWAMEGPSNLLNFSPATNPADFFNEGTLSHTHTGTSLVELDFQNRGYVVVEAGTLQFYSPLDLDANGVLSGPGNWDVGFSGAITFPRSMTELNNGVEWSGGSSSSVVKVDGQSTFSPAPGQTNPPLTITGGSTLLLNGTFTTPQLTLDGATLTGTGTIVGDIVGLENAVVQTGGANTTGSGTYASTTRQDVNLDGGATGEPAMTYGGNVHVGGTVTPTFTLSQEFPVNSTFPLVSGSSLTGTFEFVDHGRIGGRVKLTPTYSSTTAELSSALTSYATYEEWAADNFSAAELLDSAVSAKFADPDHDGLTNFQEYTFATAPRAFSANPCEFMDYDGLYLTVRFPWAEGMTDAEFEILGSSDITTADPVVPTGIQSSGNGSVSYQECQIRIDPVALEPNRFFISILSSETSP